MAKKSSKSKKEKPKKFSIDKEFLKEHLFMEVSIPAAVLVLLLLLLLVRVPYQAQETYIETRTEDVPTRVTKPDLSNPQEVRVCEEMPAEVILEPLNPYTEPFGREGYRCVAEVKVRNQEDTKGKWTYKYIFDIGGKTVETEPITKEIAELSAITYVFETEECQQGDQVSGEIVLVSGPMTEECTYVTEYPDIVVTEYEQVERKEEVTRQIEKTEPLWQMLVGYNRHEKV